MTDRVTIEIETGGAAFDDAPAGHELARILRKLADAAEGWCGAIDGRALHDLNGNRCGAVKVIRARRLKF